MSMKKFLQVFALACCVATFSFAAPFQEETNERIAVGERTTQEETVQWKQMRAIREEDHARIIEDVVDSKVFFIDDKYVSREMTELETNKQEKSIIYEGYPLPYYGSHHWAVSVTLTGEVVELNDGSLWKVKPKDAPITLTWYDTDCIVIRPNKSILSSYTYKVWNCTTGQKVRANLLEGPYYDGFYTLWITGVDYFYNKVYLNDGSIWDMSSWDSDTVVFWFVGDTVIAGVNTDWLSKHNPYMLINVNVNTWARGDVVWY